MLKGSRGNHAPLNFHAEPVRIVRHHDGMTTTDYFGEDACEQWREAMREFQWADTVRHDLESA